MADLGIDDIAPYYRGPFTAEPHPAVPGAVMLKAHDRLIAVLTYQEAYILSDDLGDEATTAKEKT